MRSKDGEINMDKICPKCGKPCTWCVNYVQEIHAFIFRYRCNGCNLSGDIAISEKTFIKALDGGIKNDNVTL